MDYIQIQNNAIHQFKAVIVENSKCWRRMHAHTDGSRKICKWVQKNSYASTWALLHEIGHLETYKTSMCRAESEIAATEWQINYLREIHIPVKRKLLDKYKEYITRTHERGLKRGLKKIVCSNLINRKI